MFELKEALLQAGIPFGFIIFFIIAMIWSSIWKFIALWKSARRNEIAWFVLFAIVNTLGILEILYIFVLSQKKSSKKRK